MFRSEIVYKQPVTAGTAIPHVTMTVLEPLQKGSCRAENVKWCSNIYIVMRYLLFYCANCKHTG